MIIALLFGMFGAADLVFIILTQDVPMAIVAWMSINITINFIFLIVGKTIMIKTQEEINRSHAYLFCYPMFIIYNITLEYFALVLLYCYPINYLLLIQAFVKLPIIVISSVIEFYIITIYDLKVVIEKIEDLSPLESLV